MTTRTVTYTSDPGCVTSVVWYIASECVKNYDSPTDMYIDGPDDDDRMSLALGNLYDAIQAAYPNCTDIYVADGGWENQYAAMSPRANTNDEDLMYEPFFDDMTAMEANAIAAAFKSCS